MSSPDIIAIAAVVDTLVARTARLEAQIEALLMADLGRRTFVYEGAEYAYMARRPNRTWDNERAVELPIVWAEVERTVAAADVLEIGNVLSAYYPVAHRVLDKYERHRSVTWNEDIMEFEPPFAPSLIVSISTLEHVGHSETPRDPAKFRHAVDRVLTWLRPGGLLMFTVPLGYNPAVIEFLRAPNHAVTTVKCLKRVATDNTWQEVSLDQAAACSYGQPFPCANAIAIVRATATERVA